MENGKRKLDDEDAGSLFLILSMIPRNKVRDGIMLFGCCCAITMSLIILVNFGALIPIDWAMSEFLRGSLTFEKLVSLVNSFFTSQNGVSTYGSWLNGLG
jgi:hypothetical protein